MIRPSQHFRPNQIANLDVWLRADTVVGNDGDAIGTWTDESGAGHNATQATGTKQPLLKTNIINGKPVLRFDGSDDYLSGTVTASTVKTLFIVAKKRTAANTATQVLNTLGNVNSGFFCDTDLVASIGYYCTGGFAATNLGGTPTNANILVQNFSALSSLKAYINGGAPAATLDPQDGYSVATTLYLGSTVGTSSWGDWDIAEVIHYTTNLSTANMDRVGGYLAAKYGLSWAASS